MIRAFRTSDPMNALWLFFIAIMLRLPAFIFPEPFIQSFYREPLSNFFFSVSSGLLNHALLNIILTTIIIWTQALWLNFLTLKYSLLFKNSYMPALLYVVVASIFPSYFFLNAAIISNFFALLLLHKMFSLYKSTRALQVVFDSGMIIGFASLFYFPATIWLLMLFFSLMMFRPFIWREWVVGFFGFAVPYVFVALFYFLSNQFPAFWEIWAPLKNSIPQVLSNFQIQDFTTLIPLFICIIFAADSLRKNFYRNVIQVRKSQQLLIIFLLISLFSFYTRPLFGINHFIITAPALSVFMANYFLSAKKLWLSEVLFWSVVLSIISLQFF